MAPYPQPTACPDDFAASRAQLTSMIARLGGPEMMSCTQEVLEDYLTATGRELQRLLMQDQLDARTRLEERRPAVAGADGTTRVRAERGHRRLLATTVGRVEVTRIAYRAPAVSNLHLADAALALPTRLHSLPLQRAVVHEVADGPLREAREGLARMTGQQLGTRQLREITGEAAHDVRDFYPNAPRSPGRPAPADGTC